MDDKRCWKGIRTKFGKERLKAEEVTIVLTLPWAGLHSYAADWQLHLMRHQPLAQTAQWMWNQWREGHERERERRGGTSVGGSLPTALQLVRILDTPPSCDLKKTLAADRRTCRRPWECIKFKWNVNSWKNSHWKAWHLTEGEKSRMALCMCLSKDSHPLAARKSIGREKWSLNPKPWVFFHPSSMWIIHNQCTNQKASCSNTRSEFSFYMYYWF